MSLPPLSSIWSFSDCFVPMATVGAGFHGAPNLVPLTNIFHPDFPTGLRRCLGEGANEFHGASRYVSPTRFFIPTFPTGLRRCLGDGRMGLRELSVPPSGRLYPREAVEGITPALSKKGNPPPPERRPRWATFPLPPAKARTSVILEEKAVPPSSKGTGSGINLP